MSVSEETSGFTFVSSSLGAPLRGKVNVSHSGETATSGGKAFQRLLDHDERFSLDHAGGSRIVGLGLSIPLLSTLVSPAFQRRHRDWVDVGPVDELSSGHPKQLDHVTTVRDGWLATTAPRRCGRSSKRRATSKVFSPICTHLGCGYRWDETDKKFLCPCHGSAYDVNGQVVGACPRPLDVLPSKVEGGGFW